MNLRLIAVLVTSSLVQGCISTHSYVDPQFHHASFGDLARSQPPYALSVKSEFQRNGVEQPRVERQLRDDVERTLRASGVVVPYDGKGSADGEISIVVNNVTDLCSAAAKGFGTGLTLGLVGSHVMDGYEMTARLTQSDSVEERKYQHAIISTVGNAAGPPGLTPVALATAFNQVVDDLVLNFLKDMQSEGRLLPKAN
jgi:hypothetical protein